MLNREYNNRVSGMDILFRYERTLPYMLSDLISSNIYIHKFINFFMRDGRKYAAIKVFYSVLRFLHASFSVDPLFIIYAIFSRHRMKYDVFVKKLGGNRSLIFPRTLSGPSQLFRCMHFFFFEVRRCLFDVRKYHEQVGLMLIRCFMRPSIINDRIKEVYKVVFENKHRLPLMPKKLRTSRKSTVYYWSLSKSFYGVTYRRDRTTVKPEYI